MCPRASCVPPTVSPAGWSQQPQRVCSTYAAHSLRLGGVCYPYWCWKAALELPACKITSEVCSGGGCACSIKWTCARKHTDRETDRQKPTRFFLLPSLISSVLFFFSATLLFCCSVSEMRHKTPRFVVCLPLTSVCLYHICPTPLSLPLLTFSPLIFPDLCSCLLFVQSSSTWAVFSLHFCFSIWLFPSVPLWRLSFLPCSVQSGRSMIWRFFCLQQQPACDVDLCRNEHCRIIFPC